MDITESSIYKEAKEVPASQIMNKEQVTASVEDLKSIATDYFNSLPHELSHTANLGKLYGSRIKLNTTANEILLLIFNSYKEVLQKELNYNNDIEKSEIINNCMISLESTIKVLKSLSADIPGEQLLTLLRSIVL